MRGTRPARRRKDPTGAQGAESKPWCVIMLDSTSDIMRKFKRAVTDSESEVRYDPVGKPGVSSLLDILAAATGRSVEDAASGYTQYGPLKADTGEAVVAL